MREGEVAVRLPADIEAVRVGELIGIAVGGADADMHVGPRCDVDAAERRVDCGPAVAELVRAFHAQKLLDRRFDEIGVLAQVAHGFRMAG